MKNFVFEDPEHPGVRIILSIEDDLVCLQAFAADEARPWLSFRSGPACGGGTLRDNSFDTE